MVNLKNHRKILATLTLFLLAQLPILYLKWGKPLVWDSTVYIGMGKYLYSLGEIGYWESFRPPILPIISGLLWKIGLPMQHTARIIGVVISTATIALVYNTTRKILDKRTALYTGALLASTYIYYWWTPYLLTGIPSAALVYATIYLTHQRRYTLAGIATGLAALTRFPAALIAAPVAAIILYRKTREIQNKTQIKERAVELVRDGAKYGTGIATLLIPYFAVNQYYYGNFLHPIIKGATVPAGNPAKYMYGLYYLFHTVQSNPFLLLAPIGLGYAVYRRKEELFLPAAALTAFYGFFTIYPHKLTRFSLLFLPLVALFSGYALREAEEKKELLKGKLPAAITVLAALMILVSMGQTYNRNNWQNPARENYLQQSVKMNGTIAANTPNMVPYSDTRFLPVRPETIKEDLKEAEEKADYYMINSCAWYCTPAIENCRKRINNFTETVKQSHRQTFQEEINECTYTIYEVER